VGVLPGPGVQDSAARRGHNPDPRLAPGRAVRDDCHLFVQSSLEVLEELVVLTRLVRASAISRMAVAGILLLPDELDFPEEEAGPDGNMSEARNPVAVDIINNGSKAIDDPRRPPRGCRSFSRLRARSSSTSGTSRSRPTTRRM